MTKQLKLLTLLTLLDYRFISPLDKCFFIFTVIVFKYSLFLSNCNVKQGNTEFWVLFWLLGATCIWQKDVHGIYYEVFENSDSTCSWGAPTNLQEGCWICSQVLALQARWLPIVCLGLYFASIYGYTGFICFIYSTSICLWRYWISLSSCFKCIVSFGLFSVLGKGFEHVW